MVTHFKKPFMFFIISCSFLLLSACIDTNPTAQNPHIHNLAYHEYTAPTCTDNGNIEYYYCTNCKMYFSDKTALDVIEADSISIPACHKWHEKHLYNKDYHYLKCQNCEEITDRSEHLFTDYVCSICGYLQQTDGLVFEQISTNQCRITAFHNSPDKEVIIPATYNDMAVVEIGEGAFLSNNNITKVIIPNSVINIADNAFRDCSNLTTIQLGKSVLTIGNSAFYNCKNLKNIAILSPLQEIGTSAFYKCSALTSLEIPDSTHTIGNKAFGNCISLSHIALPKSLVTLGEYAFSNCTKLSGELSIPVGITTIKSNTFADCRELESVILNNVQVIDNNAFTGCEKLANVTLSNSIDTINSFAFSGCIMLKEITIYDSIQYIDTGVFADCTNLAITFLGTESAWNAVTKADGWDEGLIYTITYQESKSYIPSTNLKLLY